MVNSGSQMSEHTIRTLNPQNPAEPELDGAASFNGTVFNGVVVGLNLKSTQQKSNNGKIQYAAQPKTLHSGWLGCARCGLCNGGELDLGK